MNGHDSSCGEVKLLVHSTRNISAQDTCSERHPGFSCIDYSIDIDSRMEGSQLMVDTGIEGLPASVTRSDTKSIFFGFESNILASPTRYKYVWEVGICHKRKSVYLLVN
jgi:hypothetical protein